MTEKKCRKYVETGLRVKVRFATKVKKDGKFVKKKIWYGGRITAVSKKGTKIRIKYDDGTSEVAKFPDDDVVVDAVMNGEHAKPANRFLPPSDNKGKEGETPGEGKAGPLTNSPPSHPKDESDPKVSEVRELVQSQEPQTPPESESIVLEKNEEQNQDEKIQSMDSLNEPKTPIHHDASASSEVVESSDRGAVTSPEEGELSPGITMQKRSVVDIPETKTIPSPEDVSNKASFEEQSGDTGAASLLETPNKLENEGVLSTTTKSKLAIRIPLHLSSKDVASPKATPVTKIEKEVSIDQILVDTPLQEQFTTKRKREDTDTNEDEPPLQKVKVTNNEKDADTLQEKSIGRATEANEGAEVNVSNIADEQKPLTIKVRLSQQPVASEKSEMDLPLPQHTWKKKNKKLERSKSPRPRSPLPKRALSPTKLTDEESGDLTLMDQYLPPMDESKEIVSETPAKSQDEEFDVEMKQPSLKFAASFDSAGAASRGGRKAAQQAKEKLNSKEKEKDAKDAVTLEPNKKKKKRRRVDYLEADGPEDLSNGPEWVQCDSCGKWRILPSDVKVSSLPNLWYCHMNVYDPKRNTCDAPEQSAKQASKERKRAWKKAKRLEAETQQLEVRKEKPEKPEQMNTPVNSPKPPKITKITGKVKLQLESKKKAHAVIAEAQHTPSDSGSESPKDENKKGKKPKPKEVVGEDFPEAPVEVKKPGRKRGRPARNQTSSTPQPPTRDSKDEDNVEWVQCEKCEKWRKLPPDLSADELPDTWYCSMNTWNPASANCHAPEDKADALHHEIGSSEWQLRQTQAGKYSYRQMIFGTGVRKHNRPLSERSRAAESLFVKPVSEDEENPIPTTQYSKSSAFLPRTSNFNKSANMITEDSIGIFDVLSHSNLWAQLRSMEQAKPMKVESGCSSGVAYPKFVTYENLPDDIKIGMQDVVLQILGNNALSGEDVIHEARQFPWEMKAMVGYCNADVIINTLLALVRDGIVEMATCRDQHTPMSQWIPKYRRVRSKRALAAEEAIKSSKCMKIAKPWKQREEAETQWITGQEAFH